MSYPVTSESFTLSMWIEQALWPGMKMRPVKGKIARCCRMTRGCGVNNSVCMNSEQWVLALAPTKLVPRGILESVVSVRNSPLIHLALDVDLSQH
jgi:hypothetical protein